MKKGAKKVPLVRGVGEKGAKRAVEGSDRRGGKENGLFLVKKRRVDREPLNVFLRRKKGRPGFEKARNLFRAGADSGNCNGRDA